MNTDGMNNPAFRKYLTERHGLTPEEAAYLPAQFLRADDWFDTNAYELWLQEKYREFQKQ